jgi:hypothetical protein
MTESVFQKSRKLQEVEREKEMAELVEVLTNRITEIMRKELAAKLTKVSI